MATKTVILFFSKSCVDCVHFIEFSVFCQMRKIFECNLQKAIECVS
jgi:glutaredoxin-related protein